MDYFILLSALFIDGFLSQLFVSLLFGYVEEDIPFICILSFFFFSSICSHLFNLKAGTLPLSPGPPACVLVQINRATAEDMTGGKRRVCDCRLTLHGDY